MDIERLLKTLFDLRKESTNPKLKEFNEELSKLEKNKEKDESEYGKMSADLETAKTELDSYQRGTLIAEQMEEAITKDENLQYYFAENKSGKKIVDAFEMLKTESVKVSTEKTDYITKLVSLLEQMDKKIKDAMYDEKISDLKEKVDSLKDAIPKLNDYITKAISGDMLEIVPSEIVKVLDALLVNEKEVKDMAMILYNKDMVEKYSRYGSIKMFVSKEESAPLEESKPTEKVSFGELFAGAKSANDDLKVEEPKKENKVSKENIFSSTDTPKEETPSIKEEASESDELDEQSLQNVENLLKELKSLNTTANVEPKPIENESSSFDFEEELMSSGLMLPEYVLSNISEDKEKIINSIKKITSSNIRIDQCIKHINKFYNSEQAKERIVEFINNLSNENDYEGLIASLRNNGYNDDDIALVIPSAAKATFDKIDTNKRVSDNFVSRPYEVKMGGK